MRNRTSLDGFGSQLRWGGATAVLASLTIAASAEAAGARFTTFDVPKAHGTFAVAINSAGLIAGDYGDSKSIAHGFLRNVDGTFEIFDAKSLPDTISGTYPVGIDAKGVITGYYLEGSSAVHGFVRAADGTITVFDAPGGTGLTSASAINDKSVIAGTYIEGSGASHGYLRSASGKFKTIDACTDTSATSINDKGAIAGTCEGDYSSFVRTPGGNVAIFSVTGANGTFANGINDQGTITGTWSNANTGAFEGFARAADGMITTFDPGGDTSVNAINDRGAIVGYYDTDSYHGFVRDATGTITSFNVSGSDATYAYGINAKGAITGFYYDAGGAAHGFLRSP